MTCEDYRDLLVAFEDHELSDSEETLLKKHLQECDGCSKELDDIRKFASQMRDATAPFRDSVQRISVRPNAKRPFWLAWAAIAAVLVLIASFSYLKFAGPDVDQLASWGIQHYPLVDQTHPVKGNASTVEAWFQEHHKVSIQPPTRIDYSQLTGCKMTEMNSRPVALLRLEEKPVRALFILPQKSILPLQKKVLYRDGYQIEFWKEGATLYMSLKHT